MLACIGEHSSRVLHVYYMYIVHPVWGRDSWCGDLKNQWREFWPQFGEWPQVMCNPGQSLCVIDLLFRNKQGLSGSSFGQFFCLGDINPRSGVEDRLVIRILKPFWCRMLCLNTTLSLNFTFCCPNVTPWADSLHMHSKVLLSGSLPKDEETMLERWRAQWQKREEWMSKPASCPQSLRPQLKSVCVSRLCCEVTAGTPVGKLTSEWGKRWHMVLIWSRAEGIDTMLTFVRTGYESRSPAAGEAAFWVTDRKALVGMIS